MAAALVSRPSAASPNFNRKRSGCLRFLGCLNQQMGTISARVRHIVAGIIAESIRLHGQGFYQAISDA
jgi:hypothetical protein